MNDSSNNRPTTLVDDGMIALRENSPSDEVQERLRQGMRAQWQELSETPVPVSLRSRWLPSSSIRLAVALSLCVAVLVAGFALVASLGNQQSLYAQAIAAVRKAQTVHATASMYDDNEVQNNAAEVWYDSKKGVREVEHWNGRQEVRLDDGQFEWHYRSDTNTVIKGPSRDPVGGIEEFLRPLEALDRFKAKRDPTLDLKIDDIKCRALVASLESLSPKIRYIFWLDEQNRLIRFDEQVNVENTWKLDERVDMRYNVPIPADRLTANFPTDARLIDRTAPLSAFDLKDADVTAERLGIILGIHEVRRVDEDSVFVLSTSRASQEVINRFGKIDSNHLGHQVYGSFTWMSNGRRAEDHSWINGMRPLTLAYWQRDGIDYQWILLRKTKAWEKEPGKLPVGFSIHTRGKWAEARKKAGEPQWLLNQKDVVTLDVPETPESLDTILADIYQQTQSMGDATKRGAPNLRLKSEPYSKEMIKKAVADGTPLSEAERMLVGRSSQPEAITLEAWSKEVNLMLDE
ncbi:MAG: hypothetical protein COA78_07685 [Blastopirellula sp.]|nr:MAG: hypothetical protein COA78_07685 [Blastopirellula sp.]